jgi:predicted amidohydrolase YtcJ
LATWFVWSSSQLFWLAPLNFSFAQQPSAATPSEEAVVFHGGDTPPCAGTTPEYVDALAVKGGKILFAGTLAEAEKLAGPNSKRVDLDGKTLLPGFIDTHGHFVYFGKNLVDANLFGSADIAELIARMKKQVERTPADAWIVGFGYQACAMKEGRPPTSEELDQISADRPVDGRRLLRSLWRPANGAAFKAAGISADTPDPTGGMFRS